MIENWRQIHAAMCDGAVKGAQKWFATLGAAQTEDEVLDVVSDILASALFAGAREHGRLELPGANLAHDLVSAGALGRRQREVAPGSFVPRDPPSHF